MDAGPLIVTYPLTGRSRAIVEEELGGTAEAIYLADLAPTDRADMLRRAAAVLSNGNTAIAGRSTATGKGARCDLPRTRAF